MQDKGLLNMFLIETVTLGYSHFQLIFHVELLIVQMPFV